MATLQTMLDGMARYFLSKKTITEKIGERLYDTISQERIVAMESPVGEESPRLAWFAEYRDTGEQVNRLKRGESGMVFTGVEVRCYALFPRDARTLLDLFIAAVPNNSYSTTWEDSDGNDIEIKGIHWDRSTRNTDYDETAGMSVASCVLIIPWLQR